MYKFKYSFIATFATLQCSRIAPEHGLVVYVICMGSAAYGSVSDRTDIRCNSGGILLDWLEAFGHLHVLALIPERY